MCLENTGLGGFNQTFPPDHNKLRTPKCNPPPHPYITENLLIEK